MSWTIPASLLNLFPKLENFIAARGRASPHLGPRVRSL
jgi:hypothetical protein